MYLYNVEDHDTRIYVMTRIIHNRKTEKNVEFYLQGEALRFFIRKHARINKENGQHFETSSYFGLGSSYIPATMKRPTKDKVGYIVSDIY